MIEFKTSMDPVAYEEALRFMDERVAAIHEGEAQECVWFLEHPPLYTAGTSAKESDLIDPRFPVYKSGRGGEYTYHGPGQRIAYAMLDLRKRQSQPDIKHYIWQLEEVIIRSLKPFGIDGQRREGRVGIWVEKDQGEAKIAAIGVRIRKWITLHGISINLKPDLSHFGGIVPCGISDHGVTSIEGLGKLGVSDLDENLKQSFEEIFNTPSPGFVSLNHPLPAGERDEEA